MATIINLMPHPITLRDEEGNDHVVKPSGRYARVATTNGPLYEVDGLPVKVAPDTEYGEIEIWEGKGADAHKVSDGLPEQQDGVFLLVSGLVRSRAFGRSDVFAPGTGPHDGAIRYPEGHKLAGLVQAVTRLIAAPK